MSFLILITANWGGRRQSRRGLFNLVFQHSPSGTEEIFIPNLFPVKTS